MKEVGQVIRQMREERNWTVSELANRMGKSRGYISKLETGKKPINLKNLQTFADIFGVDITDLFPNKQMVHNPLTGDEDWLFVVQQLKEKGFSAGDVYLKLAQEAIEKDKKIDGKSS